MPRQTRAAQTPVTPVKYSADPNKHTPFVDGDAVPGSNIQISEAGNNLLRNTSDGLLVEIAAAPNLQNQYVSSSSGSDDNDGTEASPLKTITYAVSRLPNMTSGNIYLKAGDTFDLTEEAGLPNGGTLAQISDGIAVDQRGISFFVYGDANYAALDAQPGVVAALYDGTNWPTIKTAAFFPTDIPTKNTCTPLGFTIRSGGSVTFWGMNLQLDNRTGDPNMEVAYFSGFFSMDSGASFSGINTTFRLNKMPLFSGPSKTSAAISLTGGKIDTSVGNAFCMAVGYNLSAPYVDTPATQDAHGTLSAVTWNAGCGTTASFQNIAIISADARTYQGLVTTNKITQA